ncbi:PDZ domain-containing protein [Marinobacter hydrocarbonoclasticus]|nr:PDZ domain-containing protein [Marinobacter nauticus]
MYRPILLFTAGALLGGAATAVWLSPDPTSCPPQAPCPADSDELAMLRWENQMLTRLVQAGLNGDISTHIQTFSAMQPKAPTAAPKPSQSAESATAAPEPPATGADALVDRLTRADLKLQRQALAEGWATGDRLVRERNALWDQARRQLSDDDYMAALHRAGRPNRLLVDTVKHDGSARALRHGDVLWALDGQRVLTRAEYREYLSRLPDNTPLTVTIIRDGVRQQVVLNGLTNNISLIADSVPVQE